MAKKKKPTIKALTKDLEKKDLVVKMQAEEISKMGKLKAALEALEQVWKENSSEEVGGAAKKEVGKDTIIYIISRLLEFKDRTEREFEIIEVFLDKKLADNHWTFIKENDKSRPGERSSFFLRAQRISF